MQVSEEHLVPSETAPHPEAAGCGAVCRGEVRNRRGGGLQQDPLHLPLPKGPRHVSRVDREDQDVAPGGGPQSVEGGEFASGDPECQPDPGEADLREAGAHLHPPQSDGRQAADHKRARTGAAALDLLHRLLLLRAGGGQASAAVSGELQIAHLQTHGASQPGVQAVLHQVLREDAGDLRRSQPVLVGVRPDAGPVEAVPAAGALQSEPVQDPVRQPRDRSADRPGQPLHAAAGGPGGPQPDLPGAGHPGVLQQLRGSLSQCGGLPPGLPAAVGPAQADEGEVVLVGERPGVADLLEASGGGASGGLSETPRIQDLL